MGRRSIELVKVLVDQILQAGYKHRALEDDIYEEKQKHAAAEKDRDHWKQARQDAHEAGELMRAEIETLKDEIKTLKVESSGLDQTAWYAEQELEKAKAEIETLRKQLDAANRLASTVASERDAAHAAAMAQQRDETVYYLQARLDEERSVIAGLREQLRTAAGRVDLTEENNRSLREQLDAAQAAVTLQRAGIERLAVFVEKIRDASWNTLRATAGSALAELDAGTEPAPVAEPLDADGEA